MTNIKRSTKTFFEVTLPDFFLPHYVSRWDAVKSHVQAYINLAFLILLIVGVYNAKQAWINLQNNINTIQTQNVQIVSPVVEVEGK